MNNDILINNNKINDCSVTKIRSRQEIVDKIEEIYKLMNDKKLEILRGIVISDALMWVLGEDYLDFEYSQRVGGTNDI